MTFEVHFIAEGVFKIEADSWNKAEATFDDVIKSEIMKPMPRGSICEVVCIKRENHNEQCGYGAKDF